MTMVPVPFRDVKEKTSYPSSMGGTFEVSAIPFDVGYDFGNSLVYASEEDLKRGYASDISSKAR